jgi:hypothetical protein
MARPKGSKNLNASDSTEMTDMSDVPEMDVKKEEYLTLDVTKAYLKQPLVFSTLASKMLEKSKNLSMALDVDSRMLKVRYNAQGSVEIHTFFMPIEAILWYQVAQED